MVLLNENQAEMTSKHSPETTLLTMACDHFIRLVFASDACASITTYASAVSTSRWMSSFEFGKKTKCLIDHEVLTALAYVVTLSLTSLVRTRLNIRLGTREVRRQS